MSGFLSGAFDQLKGMMGEGGVDAGTGGSLLRSAFDSAGGTQGVIARAEAAGLGDKVQSWIGPNSNIPLLAGEVEKIFPPEQIESFAAQHGVPAGLATQILAHMLPHAVDGQTGDGQTGTGQAGVGGVDPSIQGQAQGSGGFDFAGLAEKFLGNR